MIEESKDLIINDDEFKFLSEMVFGVERPKRDTKDIDFDISGSEGKDALLSQLELADLLQLVADYGNHRLVFPVQLNRGDFANFNMALQPPKVFEKGDHLRAWRLVADKNTCLLNQQGDLLNYTIKDLSASGFSLLINNVAQGIFPKQLNHVYLQLPNGKRLAVSATQTRRINNNTVAYSLEGAIDDATFAVLAEYLSTCHAKQYPQAYQNSDNLKFI